ncbi:uncharacterized protein LOC117321704 [Pecten maximus]|uniref:uncharacterized protein LOC117321704 n=1 Tax=Pecten maximus TaxID=6579 RepID=UPI0014583FAD|nr:uncharacterized protein LOC117321704 [Pecten maximus]
MESMSGRTSVDLVSTMDNLTDIIWVFLMSGLTRGLQITGTDLRSGKVLTRCVTRHADYMNITCPNRYVMLAPKILAGYSDKQTCLYNRRDCLGISSSLSKESQACANQETCTIKLRRVLETLVPFPGQRKICKGKPLTYVSVILPVCVPKYAIHAMCLGREASPILSSSGVIDSSYIHGLARNMPCIRRFGSTGDIVRLTLNFLDIQVGSKNRPKIIWTSEKGKLRKRSFQKQSTFSEKGSKFEIEWRPNNTGASEQGFILSYDVKLIGQKQLRLANDQPLRNPTRAVVQATLENKMTRNKLKSIMMSCPRGEVIYSPDVNVTSSEYPGCMGLSPNLLVQRNECFWRRNCTIKWGGPAYLTMTPSPRCFGRSGDNLRSGNHQCIKEDNIFDICDTKSSRRLKSAMIRSHEKYPWHYKGENKKCRLRIRIGRNRKLKLKVDDVDIDDERDSFVIKHIRRGRKPNTIFSGNGGNMFVTLRGGAVEITLSIKRRTKSGSGFALHYERVPKYRKKARRGKSNKRRSHGMANNQLSDMTK